MLTLPHVVFAGYNELKKQWEVVIDGEIPIDKIAPIENGDEKDPDPVVRVFMPLKRQDIEKRGCCIAPYMPIRSTQGGQHLIVVGFIADFRVENVDEVMSDFVKDFSEELERYIRESFFEESSLPEDVII